MNKEINKILIAGTEYDIRDSRFDEASQAETARQEAEQGRVTAEQQRVDAEAARAEEFATFEGKIAAKEDAANKVTSIGADANNTTFPTTRAVLNSIAEVKNIEVTPEMLSESTKQYINASGGGTITNLADDEDLTSVGNVLKLANKDYSPTSYSGMGRVYLRKNMVDGKNILTQEMITKENTIYIIQYDYDLNGATINVPANCTLDFQGGSLANGVINLNSGQIIGERCLRCKISNPKNNTINISAFDLDYFSPEGKVELFNDLCSKCNLNIDVDSIELNDSVVVSGNISIIGLNRNAIYRPKIIFNNSAGFVYTGTHNQNSTIKDINIESEGTCIQFIGSVYQFYFENLKLKSNNGNCVEASGSFNIRFIKVIVSAPNGAGFRGFLGNTTSWHNCASDSCFTVFQNCRGYIEDFNGTWGTSSHFMCDDDSIPVGYGRISTIVNSNIESFKESPFVLKGSSDNLCFIKSSIYVYKSAEDGKYHYPVIDANALDGLRLIDSSLNTSPADYIDGVYPIMSGLIGNVMPKNYYSNGSLYLRDKNILFENINTGQNTLGIKHGGSGKHTLFNSVDMAQNKLLPYSCRILRTEIVVPDTDAAIELSDLIDSYVLNTQEDVAKSVNIKLSSLFDGGLMRVAPFEVSFLNNTSNVTFNIGLYGKMLQLLPGQKGSYKIDGWRSGLYDVSSLNLIPRYQIFEAKALPTITNSAPTTQGLYGYFKGCNTVVIFDGSKWRFTNGACANNVTSLIGTSSVRNGMTLTADNVGFQYFDTTLGKPIWWNGSAWVDATGQEV